MKIFPIVNLSRKDEQNVILRELIRQNSTKINRIVFVTPPKEKQNLSEIIAEKENIDFSEKIKQFNKEIFGI